jgi:GTP-binding protein
VIVDAGTACVIVANKWDLALSKAAIEHAGSKAARGRQAQFASEVLAAMPYLAFADVAFTVATTGYGVDAILGEAAQAADNCALRIPTMELNRTIRDAVAARPYQRSGRPLKVYYATMARVKPPTVVLFVNEPRLAHFSYTRYLENRLRSEYGFAGTPMRLLVRQRRKRHEDR